MRNTFEVLASPVKSPNDKKEYKVIKLQNGLVACLIADTAPVKCDDFSGSEDESGSDNEESKLKVESEVDFAKNKNEADEAPMKKVSDVEQKMAAAALCVNVGSLSDPKDIPGLAHFLEHMVFMGSEKYPGENDFNSFIKKRGGSDNASTDYETTVFYFDCLKKHLFKALDRFAQFFIAPLMRESSMTREREAVESEFQIILPNDSYREAQLLCSLAKPDSPVNSFLWGNLITLRDNVTDEKLHADLHDFRKRHYSAHRMTVAIQAQLPMEKLQGFVLDCFSGVSNNNQPPNDFKKYENSVFDTPQFSKLYYIKPQLDVCQLYLTWYLPSLLKKYKTKAFSYVAWLIGDEGKGSLLSHLKKKLWALALSAGNSRTGMEHNSIYHQFSVKLVLTPDGLAHVVDVITAVFSYINLLKTVGPQERIFKELQNIEDVSFKFAAEPEPVDYVEGIAQAMHFYPPEDYIIGSKLYFEYNPEEIISFLNHLVPNKMNIVVMSNIHKEEIIYEKKEKWFGTLYTDKDIPLEWIERWKNAQPESDMNLPPPNPFLTTDFTLLPEEQNNPEYPEKVLETPIMEVWYKKDQKFKLPIACYYLYLISPLVAESALSQCKSEILLSLFDMQLAESIYPAQKAELSYFCYTDDRGFVFKISGYNQKLPIVMSLLSDHLKKIQSELSQDMFVALKEKLMDMYYNQLIEPSTITADLRLNLLIDKYFTSTEKFASISQVTYEDMKIFCVDFLQNLFIKALVQGNVDKQTAVGITQEFVQVLGCSPLDKKLYPQFKIWELPKGEKCCRVKSLNQNDSNSFVSNYYQSGPYNLRDSIILELIMMIIEEPLFDILRTKEQLGYSLYCKQIETFGIMGYLITVNAQATKNTTTYVDQRIENFISTMQETLNKMSNNKFNQVKRDLIKLKQCADVVLQEEVSRNWSEITEDDYMFDRLKKEVVMIETIKIADVRKFWEVTNILGDNQNYKKLTIQVVGYNINSEDGSPSKINNVCGVYKQKDAPEDSRKRKSVLTLLSSLDQINHPKEYFINDLTEFRKDMIYYQVSANQLKK